MSYPGNTSLSTEVQQRILRSLQQTVDLVSQGNESEAQLGCEFILGMDPLFRPATVLRDRLKSSARPIAIEDLFAAEPSAGALGGDDKIVTADDLWTAAPLPTAGTPVDDMPMADAPVGEASDTFASLPSLDSLAGDKGPTQTGAEADLTSTVPTMIPEPPAPQQAPPTELAPATPSAPEAAAGGLGVVLKDLIDRGQHEQVLQIAQNQRSAVEADPQLAAMVTEAQTRLETSQYVRSFLDAAQRAHAEGKLDEAERLMAKARILDPDNPELATLSQAQTSTAVPAPDDDALLLSVEDDDNELPGLLRDEDSTGLELAVAPVDSLNLANESFSGAAEAAEINQAAGGDAPAWDSPQDPRSDAGPDRIESLLAEGQSALNQGELQGAIDIWSRIFLVDIDNGEASRRIEDARQRKAEAERQADEVFHEGVAKIDTGDLEAAATAFRRVLELQPGHAMASEYLEQIDSGQTPSRPSPLLPDSLEIPKSSSSLPSVASEGTPSLDAAVERDRMVAVKGTDRRLILIGGLVFLVVVVGGFLLYRSRDALFPNATGEQEATAAVNSTIRRATILFERGKTDTAIELLESIEADDPALPQAQALLTQYRAAADPGDEPAPEGESPGLPPELVARREIFLDGARDALSAGQNIRARRYLARANAIAPLEGEETLISESVATALAAISSELTAFESAEWERVLPQLWRRYDEDPGNPDLRLLIADSYYNLALRSLQRGTPADAAALLQSALEVEPDNEALQRMLGFAETYRTRPQDLLYRIYVKYLPSRT